MRNTPPKLLRFPQSRVKPKTSAVQRDLGLTKLSLSVGNSKKNPMGHWCSKCQGIWYSYFLEVECPKCGNRHG